MVIAEAFPMTRALERLQLTDLLLFARLQASRRRPIESFRMAVTEVKDAARGWQRPERKCEHGAIRVCWHKISSISFSL